MMEASHNIHPGESEETFTKRLIKSALAYASNGYPVFPLALKDGQKRPLVRIGKGDAHGSLASTSPEKIKRWWTRWPLAMIAMPTGKPSGVIVLDVDQKGGVDGFKSMRDLGWELPPETLEIKTPSGGSHFYFKTVEGQDIRSSAGKLGPGLDIRANGGIIVLPPSRPNLDTGEYHFVIPQDVGSLI